MTPAQLTERKLQDMALAQIREDMRQAQHEHIAQHNITKHAKTFIGQGTRGIPSYATTTNHNER